MVSFKSPFPPAERATERGGAQGGRKRAVRQVHRLDGAPQEGPLQRFPSFLSTPVVIRPSLLPSFLLSRADSGAPSPTAIGGALGRRETSGDGDGGGGKGDWGGITAGMGADSIDAREAD